MATRSIVPVYRVRLVKSDRLSKVLYGLFIFEKAVPYKSSAVVARSVVLILHQNLVKVLQSHWQPVAANFFADGPKMVQSLDI